MADRKNELLILKQIKYTFLLLVAILLSGMGANAQISGPGTVCVGSSATLTCSSPAGGTWSSSNVAVATVSSAGVVVGGSAGTTMITYGLSPTFYTTILTVNPLPTPISGVLSFCVGSGSVLSSAPAGGTWASSDPAIATIGSTGLVTGLVAGTTTINYYSPGTGCATSTFVTVNPSPAYIYGSSVLCVGGTVTYSDASPGGTWSSSAPAVLSISATGVASAMMAGAANISYTLPTGCMSVKHVTVNPLPSAISGPSSICAGALATLSATPTGGTWSSSIPSIVSVSSTTGIISGVTAGTATITYTLSTGCMSTTVITVSPMPGAITGPSAVCAGSSILLSNSVAGGVWSLSSTSVASLSTSTGATTVLTGISGGATTVYYTVGSGCTTSTLITVNPLPSAGAITSTGVLCSSASYTLHATVSGGLWSSSTPSVAVVASDSVLVGVSTGTTTITYVVSGVCGSAYTTAVVSVTPAPAAISGTLSFCNGTSSLLTNSVPGGVWTSSTPSVATVDASTGNVTSVSAGTATISYSLGGCYTTSIVTVNPAPSPVAGSLSLCVGSAVGMSDTVSGGTWSSSAPGTAIITTVGSSTGVVTGMAAGTTVISYAIGSCLETVTITVNPLPVVTASAAGTVCGGGRTLTATGGGTYAWTPAIGLSCTACAAPTATPPGNVVYTVVVTDTLGCSSAATVSLTANKISGHIYFGFGTPVLTDCKVWLVQYNPLDSSIISVDSQLTCSDGGQPYYEFLSPVMGSYMVKARLLSSTAGTTGYVPTYGDSTTDWFMGSTVTHVSGIVNVQDIYMRYGTVPAGPGFISGYVYSGAGKGTSGEVPEAGLLVFLKEAATGKVVTYTYTNSTGAYTFGGLSLTDYIVDPVDFDYYTTPSATVTLSPTAIYRLDVTFKKHTLYHTIFPFVYVGVPEVAQNSLHVYPNPAHGSLHIERASSGTASVHITDAMGRVVWETSISKQTEVIDVSMLAPGWYSIQMADQTGVTNYPISIQ